MGANVIKRLSFSKNLDSVWITNVREYRVDESTIVVNISNTNAIISGPLPRKVLRPMTSTIVKGINVQSAESLVLIRVPTTGDISNLASEDGWCQLTALVPDFPPNVPLYKSRQFEVGTSRFDPKAVLESTEAPRLGGAAFKAYRVKVNLWFCPARTDCGIHNHHTDPEMLEVHTQVSGTGRMQKFRENDHRGLYEEVMMSPGFTHSPFTGLKEDGRFYYGWHQYYSDTECVWMAVEYHPAA